MRALQGPSPDWPTPVGEAWKTEELLFWSSQIPAAWGNPACFYTGLQGQGPGEAGAQDEEPSPQKSACRRTVSRAHDRETLRLDQALRSKGVRFSRGLQSQRFISVSRPTDPDVTTAQGPSCRGAPRHPRPLQACLVVSLVEFPPDDSWC